MNEEQKKLIKNAAEGANVVFGVVGRIYSVAAIFFSVIFIIAALLVDSTAFHVDGIPDFLTRISLIFVVVAVINIHWIIVWLSGKFYKRIHRME